MVGFCQCIDSDQLVSRTSSGTDSIGPAVAGVCACVYVCVGNGLSGALSRLGVIQRGLGVGNRVFLLCLINHDWKLSKCD